MVVNEGIKIELSKDDVLIIVENWVKLRMAKSGHKMNNRLVRNSNEIPYNSNITWLGESIDPPNTDI